MNTLKEAGICIETYEQEIPADPIAQMEQDSFFDECDKRVALATSLGLTKQAATLEQKKLERQWQLTIPYPLLSDKERSIWAAYLPTSYGQWASRSLEDYMFDLIPYSVLSLWNNLKQEGVFDWFEIRTPERQHPDPILLGGKRNSDGRWLIARWGESLKPFEEIKKEVQERTTVTFTNMPQAFLSQQAVQSNLLYNNSFSGLLGRSNFH